MDAALLDRCGPAILLGHFVQEQNHSNAVRIKCHLVIEPRFRFIGHQHEDSYLHIDSDVSCFADKDSYDNNGIVEKIASKRTQMEVSPIAKGDGEEDGEPMVTHAAARHSVQFLQCYFVEQDFSDNTDASLDVCSNLIYIWAHARIISTFIGLGLIVCGYNQLIFVMSYQKFAYSGQPLYWAKMPKTRIRPNKAESAVLKT